MNKKNTAKTNVAKPKAAKPNKPPSALRTTMKTARATKERHPDHHRHPDEFVHEVAFLIVAAHLLVRQFQQITPVRLRRLQPERRLAGHRDQAATAVIAADTFALHRGTPPRSRPRLVTWIRYGLYENDAYKTDGTRPLPSSILGGRVPGDALTRHVSRLVLDWP